MERFWFLTWTTYGTWLSGDSRGFVGNVAIDDGPEVRHNEPGTPYDADLPRLGADARSRLKGQAVWLKREHASPLLTQFQETAAYCGWSLIASAIMANHIHLVVGVDGDPDPSKLLQDYKSYGSRRLNREFAKPASGTWWTESGSKRKLKAMGNVFDVVKYVRDQDQPLMVWLNVEAIRRLFDEALSSSLLAAHQGADAPRSPVPAAPERSP